MKPVRKTIVSVALVSVIAGCAVQPGQASSGPTTQPVSPEIRSVYLAYWDAYLAASSVSDPDDARLAEYAQSPYLDEIRAVIAAARRQGRVVKGTVGHRLEGMTAESGVRRVTDCIDLDGWLIHDAASGEKVPGQLADRPSQLAVYTLRHSTGRWQVSAVRSLGDC